MDQDQKSNNVLQFPGKRKEEEVAQPVAQGAPHSNSLAFTSRILSNKLIAGAVLAVMVASAAVNNFVYRSAYLRSEDLASNSQESMNRMIASVEKFKWERDAAWEKDLAERLASSHIRSLASTNIGRAATQEEKLRWGVLEEKYTITYRSDSSDQIGSILLQGDKNEPAYVLDREKFLSDFGHLFEANFDFAQLKSVEKSEQNIIESYTLFGKDSQPKGEVRFELDRHKRLLSLKVGGAQI